MMPQLSSGQQALMSGLLFLEALWLTSASFCLPYIYLRLCLSFNAEIEVPLATSAIKAASRTVSQKLFSQSG